MWTSPPASTYSRRSVLTWLTVGPVLLPIGVLLMMRSDAWKVSHLIFLAGTVAMLPLAVILYDLFRRIRRRWIPAIGLVLTVAGTLALGAQFVIDFVVMRLAGWERPVAGDLFDRIQDSTTFLLVFYAGGPALLFVGLAFFGVAAMVKYGVRSWPGPLLLFGSFAMGFARGVESRSLEVAALVLIPGALAGLAMLTARNGSEKRIGEELVRS